MLQSGEHPPEFYESLWKTISSGQEWRGEFLNRRKDGTFYWEAACISPVLDTQGNIIQYVAVKDDITQQKLSAARLVEAERMMTEEATKLRSMIEGMDEGIVVADANDVVTEVNHWFLDKTGLTAEEVVGRSLWDLHPHSEAAAHARALIDAFRDGSCRTTQIVNREMLGMQLSLRVQPIFENDRYQGVILNVINVTDLVEACQAAESASQAKSYFLANMSHEIRTPMTAILGFTDMLLDNLREPAAVEAARIVKRNGEHLLQIINDVLDISKIEAGKVELEMIGWSPRQVVAEVVSLLHVRADAKGLTLADEYMGPLPETITTDPNRLRQILINLVGNAIKFTESGGVRIVTRLIECGKDEPKLSFAVIDTGIGIPEDLIESLFEPFTQADGSSSRKFEGTGLGLAISRRLAGLLGGEIAVTSVPSRGSTFTLTVATGSLQGVPMVEQLDASPPRDEQSTGSTRRTPAKFPCRVLLAEDIPDNQRLISAILSEWFLQRKTSCD